MIETARPIHPSVLTIRMDRPEKRNALDAALVLALTDALAQADADPTVRAVVLTGTGKAFSAGADLAALQSLADASFEENLKDSRRLLALFERIRTLSKPVVARVNGHAIAGGCGLACVCDHVIVARPARMGFTEVRIGFVPALVSVYLHDRLGGRALRDLLLTGRLVDADEAARLGLVDRVVDAEDLDAAVAEVAGMLARECSGQGIAATKALLAQMPGMPISEALDLAARANAQARSTEDCRAGVAAFLERTGTPWREAWDRDAP